VVKEALKDTSSNIYPTLDSSSHPSTSSYPELQAEQPLNILPYPYGNAAWRTMKPFATLSYDQTMEALEESVYCKRHHLPIPQGLPAYLAQASDFWGSHYANMAAKAVAKTSSMQAPMPLPSAPAYISPAQYQPDSNVNPYGSIELKNNEQPTHAHQAKELENYNKLRDNKNIAEKQEMGSANAEQNEEIVEQLDSSSDESESDAINDKEENIDKTLQSRLTALSGVQAEQKKSANINIQAGFQEGRAKQAAALEKFNKLKNHSKSVSYEDGHVPGDADSDASSVSIDLSQKMSRFQRFKNWFAFWERSNAPLRSSLSTKDQVLQDKQVMNRLLIKYDHSSPNTSEELLDANHPYFVKGAQLDQKKILLETRLHEINQDLAKLVDLENNIKLQAKTCAQIDLNTSLTYLQDEYKKLTNEVETILTNKVRQFTILKTLFYVSLFIGGYYILKYFNLNPLRYIGFALDYVLTSVKTKYDLDTNSKVSKKFDILKALHKVHSNNESIINASSAVELARVIKNKNK
jgi:hypothetical protein